MKLINNPFHLLSASPRDTRHKLTELSQLKSLEHDPKLVSEARQILTNPKKRIQAELSWFPGVSVRKVEQILEKIEEDNFDPYFISSLPTLAKCNMILAMLPYLANLHKEDDYVLDPHGDEKIDNSLYTMWLFKLVDEFDNTDIQNLINVINEDRLVAGFSEISEISILNSELRDYHCSCVKQIQNSLQRFDRDEMVSIVLALVLHAIKSGKCIRMVDTLIDNFYIPEMDHEIVEKRDRIRKIVYRIKAIISLKESSLKGFNSMVNSSVKEKKYNIPHSPSPLTIILEEYKIELIKFKKITRSIQWNFYQRGLIYKLSKIVTEEALNIVYDIAFETNEKELASNIWDRFYLWFNDFDTLSDKKEKLSDHIQSIKREIQKNIPKYLCTIIQGQESLEITKEYIIINETKYKLSDIYSIDYRVYNDDKGKKVGTTIILDFCQDGEIELSWLSKNNCKSILNCLYKAIGKKLIKNIVEDMGYFKPLYDIFYDDGVCLLEPHTSSDVFFKWYEVKFENLSHDKIHIKSHIYPKFERIIDNYTYRNIFLLEKILKKFLKKRLMCISDCFRSSDDTDNDDYYVDDFDEYNDEQM